MTDKQKKISPASKKVETSKKPPSSAPTKKTDKTVSKVNTSGLSWVAIILSLVIAGLGAFVYMKFQQQLDALSNKSEQLEQRTKGHKTSADQTTKDLTQQLQAFEKLSGEKLELLQEQVGKSKRQWLIAEAEYLTSIANSRLRLAQDVGTALIALKAADQRLRKNGDPLTFPVRAQLAKEIAALASTDLPDIIGISSQLIALETTVGKLEISKVHTEIAKTADSAKANNTPPPIPENIKETLRDAWENFSKLIVIRRHNQPLAALMAPEQVEMIRKNLALKIEGARLALISQDQALYIASLAIVADWLNDYFDPDNTAVNATIKQIGLLKKEKITMTLPDISLSLQMLREFPVLKLGNEPVSDTPR